MRKLRKGKQRKVIVEKEVNQMSFSKRVMCLVVLFFVKFYDSVVTGVLHKHGKN